MPILVESSLLRHVADRPQIDIVMRWSTEVQSTK